MAVEGKPTPGGRLPESPRPTLEWQLTELQQANRRLKRKLFDLYTLFEISRNLSGLMETEQLLDNLLLTAIGQMGIGSAAVVIDRDEESPVLDIYRAKGSADKKGFAPRFEKGGGLLLRLQATRMPVTWDQIEHEPYLSKEDRETLKYLEAEMICPMLIQQQVRGILVVSRKLSGAAYEEDDKEFLSILINQFTVAVDNARLYESERDAHLRLREAQAQLVHSEKLAAMGRLSATIAHEVNNPLGIIKNYLHILNDDSSDPDQARDNLGIVSDEVNRIAGIIRRLLDFHRPATPGEHDLDLWRVIEDCLKITRKSRANQNIEVESDPERIPAPVRGNAEELKQVFLNLLMNAIDAMPDGGTLSVRVIMRRRTVLALISDTGPGIAPDVMPRLFEPFVTTKQEGQGTGLGLYVCYGIVQRHGGRISARNRKEGGATFRVRLPIRDEG